MTRKYVLIGIAILFLAIACGTALALWIFQHFKIYIPLHQQEVNIDLQEPLQAEVRLHDDLNVDVAGRVNVEIPIQEQF